MNEIKTNNGGSITYHTYTDGVDYALYIPPNVNADTPIFTYTYGSGGKSGWHYIFDCLTENGRDSIIIMPSMNWSADWGKNTNAIINSVRNEYGITNLNVSGSGFSMGGFGGTVTVAENIRQNPGLDPQVVYLIDDYSGSYETTKKMLNTNNRIELFKENNTIFFAYGPPRGNSTGYQAYLEAGLNVIRANPENKVHLAICTNFFKNGIYDYMGGASLPTEGYEYQIYNKETGQWEDIAYDKISTINKLYDYYSIDTLQSKIKKIVSLSNYVLKSDSGIIEQYLNNILSAIKQASYLNSSVSGFGGSSTTSVPSQIPACVNKYLSNVSRTVIRLTTLMDAVAEIDPAYQEADRTLLAMINPQATDSSQMTNDN